MRSHGFKAIASRLVRSVKVAIAPALRSFDRFFDQLPNAFDRRTRVQREWFFQKRVDLLLGIFQLFSKLVISRHSITMDATRRRFNEALKGLNGKRCF